MLLPLDGRVIAYDLLGPDTGTTVCMTHSLASDSGMWQEQVPPLLSAGFRVLRIDMRGHGGSTPAAGDYTMSALAADVVAVLDRLRIARVHYIGLSIGGMIGQAFAIEHADRVLSAMWCDTMPATPPNAAASWGPRMQTVREANSLEPLADATVERWLTDAAKARNPGRWRQIRDTVAGTTPAGSASPPRSESPAAPSPARATSPPERPKRSDRGWVGFVKRLTARLLPARRSRSNPRVVKRKYTKWHVKRDHHANWPQPTQPPTYLLT